MIRSEIRAARPLRVRANFGLWNRIETRKALLTWCGESKIHHTASRAPASHVIACDVASRAIECGLSECSTSNRMHRRRFACGGAGTERVPLAGRASGSVRRTLPQRLQRRSGSAQHAMVFFTPDRVRPAGHGVGQRRTVRRYAPDPSRAPTPVLRILSIMRMTRCWHVVATAFPTCSRPKSSMRMSPRRYCAVPPGMLAPNRHGGR